RKELATDADLVDRMRIEGEALQRLSHENVIAVSEVGKTSDGRPFVVMDLLAGRTLADELEARGALPVNEAIGIALQMLRGLHAAHELGVVHRDVKPANLFLCEQGARRVLKVIDFGVAKVVADPSRPSAAPAPLAVPTREGVIVGTPRFASPEQIAAAPLDR